MEIRIQKALSDAGVCSRRKAEELILAKKVKVNGRLAKIGDKLDPKKDLIMVDNEKIDIKPTHKEKLYIMLYKPRGYVTTMSDELGRKTICELVSDLNQRVYPIGRLDKNSEGLIFMTNDGEFANMMTHPKYHVSKTYRVTVTGEVTEEKLLVFSTGIKSEDGDIMTGDVKVVTEEPQRTVLLMTLYEGKNRQIRKMCEAVDLTVIRLKRVSIGPVKLGMLKPGTYRELKKEEIMALRRIMEKNARREGTNDRNKKRR